MAAYYHGSSEIQAVNSASAPSDHHGMQTLYLMNPSFLSSYSDHHQQQNHHQQQSPSSMLFFNPSNNTLNPGNIPHTPPINHNLLGINLQAAATDVAPTDNNCRTNTSEFVPAYNIWASFDQNSVDATGLQLDVSGFRRTVVASPTRQGLSLSLSSQQVQPPGGSYDNNRPISHEDDHRHIQAMISSGREDIRVSGSSPSSVSAASNGVAAVQSIVLGSKYLQAAQELLDEVVNVGKGIKSYTKEKMKMTKESYTRDGSSCGGNDDGGGSSTKQGVELTTAQRQELQMKKAKLVNMLDEVEQRYRQYHTQMQIVVSSFEQAAGLGTAKSYTALALRTISKQFRCLKNAIFGQVKATSKSLGEDDCLGVKVEGSRLRYVDHQLRQQRALQQLGMLQHNAWRPQRGLPERAVSVLRAWLFEHFLHPYPKDSDKHMLAKQTGLTRSQVSNWFINARVRLWKPMVEEMYLEEIKEQETNGGIEENSGKDVKKGSCFNNAGHNSSTLESSKPEKPITTQHNTCPTKFSNSTISVSLMAGRGGGESSIQRQQPGFALIRPSELEGISQISPKKPRSCNNSHDMQNSPGSILAMDMDMKQRETNKEMINMINFGGDDRLISNNIGGYGGYNPIGDIGRFSPEQLAPRFGANNNVSLTLGLQHCENLTLSGSHQQNFISNQNIPLGRRLEIEPNEPDLFRVDTSQNSHPTTGFENIDIENKKRFVAQLLPDFVS